MTRKQRLTWGLLLAATALGVTAIILVPVLHGGLEREAVLSPIGRFVIITMAAGLAIVGLLSLLLRRCARRPHPPIASLFRDEGGTAAVEMLLALPIIAATILVMIQAVFLWNANLVFHYAGYASARAAVSIIPDDLELSGEGRCLMYNNESTLTPNSLKFARIRRAAVLALVPISGRLPTSVEQYDPELSGEHVAQFIEGSMMTAMAEREAWMARVADQFRWADYFVELVITEPHHWSYPDSRSIGDHCPYRHGDREWGANDWVYFHYCPYIEATYDYAPWEEVELNLLYPYEMNVTYANKMLYELLRANHPELVQQMTIPGSGRTSYIIWMERNTKFVLSG